MKHYLLAFSLFFFGGSAFSQVIITSADFPVEDDIYFVSSTLDSVDFTLTGSFQFWDFSYLQVQTQSKDTFHSVDITPNTYQFIFDNTVLFPEYAADYAIRGQGIDLFGQLTIEDVYDFHQVDTSGIYMTGFGARLNGFPTPIRYDSIERLYKLPMSFQQVDSSGFEFGIAVPTLGYYGGRGVRTNTVDGWGSIETPYGSFSALRVKTEIQRTDSLYVDLVGFGFNLPRNSTEYKWFANGEGIPLLKITTNDFFGQETVTAVEYKDSARSLTGIQPNLLINSMDVYPNPTSNQLTVELPLTVDATALFYNALGQQVMEVKLLSGNTRHQFSIEELPAGQYRLHVVGADKLYGQTIIKQ